MVVVLLAAMSLDERECLLTKRLLEDTVLLGAHDPDDVAGSVSAMSILNFTIVCKLNAL
jgi:hypothetical protein